MADLCDIADRWTVAGLFSFPLHHLIQNAERNAFFSMKRQRPRIHKRRSTHTPTVNPRDSSLPIKPNLPRRDRRHHNIVLVFAAPRQAISAAAAYRCDYLVIRARSRHTHGEVTTPCACPCRDWKSASPAFAPSLRLGSGSLHRPFRNTRACMHRTDSSTVDRQLGQMGLSGEDLVTTI
jgi:hypothetical protein